MDIYNLVSLGGVFGLMAIAWLFSADRTRLNWRVIGWGTGLQLAFAAMVFWSPGSSNVFLWLNDAVLNVLQASQAGQKFVFGNLGTGEGGVGFILAFQALPVIIFFSALMGLLYYWRIMPLIIRGFAFVFTKLMRVSGAESLCTASNIFVGIEATTAIRPYLVKMTRSEYCTILTAGMATVASSTMGIYVLFLKDVFPTIAGHLISASVLSAPAALVMSKILLPESGEPETLGTHLNLAMDRESSGMEAIINGAMAGVKLVVGVGGLLIAFLGMLALVNMMVGGTGKWFGLDLSLERMLSYVFMPLSMLIGVPPGDAAEAGRLLGERLIVTEIPAYQHLAEALKQGTLVHPRSAVLIAYALCGFAHVASLAIFVGGTVALAPDRRKDIVSAGPRALLAATLACLMTGAVAGVFFHSALTMKLH